LALDVIKEVGPAGEFLTHEHTFRGMRSQSRPELIDRKSREAWENAGSLTAHQRAMEKVKYILENHTPLPVPDDVLAKIRSIVEETEAEMGISVK
ncbi:MAG: Trimethylamine methyltransferase MttB, partial [Deltaproteobacteria bacterium]